MSGPVDFEFRLYSGAVGGLPIDVIPLVDHPVDQGVFTAQLNFGSTPFQGYQELWLEVWVEETRLNGRQRVTPTPYSIATRGIVVDPMGLVGIGTSAPDGMLHLGLSPREWTIGRWRKGLRLDGINAIELGAGNAIKYGLGSSNDNLYLFSTPGENATAPVDYRTIITGAGDYGIGTLAPEALVHISRDLVDNKNLLELTYNAGNTGSTSEDAAIFRVTSSSLFRPFVSIKGGQYMIDAQGNVLSANGMFVGYQVPGGNTGFVSIGQSAGEYGNIGHGFGFTQVAGAHLYRFNDHSSRLNFDQGGFRFFGAERGLVNQTIPWRELMYIDRSGKVAIGMSVPDPDCLLSVNGPACKPGGGMWTSLSDARLKENVRPLTGTLDRLMQLHGYDFQFTPEAVKNHPVLEGRQIGLIAQEVATVFPDWVSQGSDGYLRVTERATTALMVEALRDLRAEKDAQLEALRDDNRRLQDRVDSLHARLEKLERAAASQ